MYDIELSGNQLTHGLIVTYKCPDGRLVSGKIVAAFVPADNSIAGITAIDGMPGQFFRRLPKAFLETLG